MTTTAAWHAAAKVVLMATPPGPGMPPMAVRMRRRGDLAVLAISGELDVAAAENLTAEVFAEVGDAPLVIVDVARLTFIDGTGLRYLRQALSDLRDRGKTVKVSHFSSKVERYVRFLDAAAERAASRLDHATS